MPVLCASVMIVRVACTLGHPSIIASIVMPGRANRDAVDADGPRYPSRGRTAIPLVRADHCGRMYLVRRLCL